jgi:hypothetical protein
MNRSFAVVTIDQVLDRIRGEFLEMPGLRLTRAQAQRLWGLDEQLCTSLLERLIKDRFLCRRADGMYVRATEGALEFPPVRMAKAASTPATAPARRPADSVRAH